MSKGQLTNEYFTIDSPRGKSNEELFQWAKNVDRHLRTILLNIANDFRQGNSGLEVYDSEPTIDELDTGQRVLYDTGTEVRMYTALEDRLFYVTLTEVT